MPVSVVRSLLGAWYVPAGARVPWVTAWPMEVVSVFIQNTHVVARNIVFFSLVPTLQGKGPAPVGARLAPTLRRVNQSPVYCLRLRLTGGV